MSNSEHCLSQARLVALQLSLLSSGKQVLNLDSKMVQKFMEEQPFIEVSKIDHYFLCRHSLICFINTRCVYIIFVSGFGCRQCI